MSNLSAFPYIAERSEGTPGLWNLPLSIISANIAALDSGLTSSSPSGNTFSFLTNIETSGGAHFQHLSIGSTPPSYVTTAAVMIEVNSAYSDYLYFVDSSAQKSSYLIGSRAGNLADGLNIWDASAGTMIVSLSKQSVRFYQQVVAPLVDTGGGIFNVLAYGAATPGTLDDVPAIRAAIVAAPGGGKILFPGGQTYIIGSFLTINTARITLSCSGSTLSFLPGGAIRWIPTSGFMNGAGIDGANVVGASGTTGIWFSSVVRPVVRDIFASGFSGNGGCAVRLVNSYFGIVENSDISSNRIGVSIENGSNANMVLDSRIFRNLYGINLQSDDNAGGLITETCSIIGGAVELNNSGIYLNGARACKIMAVHIESNDTGIDFAQTAVAANPPADDSILDCSFYGSATTQSGFSLLGPRHHLAGNRTYGPPLSLNSNAYSCEDPSYSGYRAHAATTGIAALRLMSDAIMRIELAPDAGYDEYHLRTDGALGAEVNSLFMRNNTQSANLMRWGRSTISSLVTHEFQRPSWHTTGTAIQPSLAFASEISLGWFRSTASTMNLSYGTLLHSTGSIVCSVLSLNEAGGGVALRFPPSDALRTHVAGSQVYFDVGLLHVRDGDSGSAGTLNVSILSLTGDAASRAILFPSGTAMRTGAAGSTVYLDLGNINLRNGDAGTSASFATLNLNQARLVSMRTVASSLDSTTMAKGETAFTVIGSGASFALHSGSTIYFFTSSSSTKAP